MQRIEGLEDGLLYIGRCILNDEEKDIGYNNPHCIEYFCNIKNITECTACAKYLTEKKKVKLFNDEYFEKVLKISDQDR